MEQGPAAKTSWRPLALAALLFGVLLSAAVLPTLLGDDRDQVDDQVQIQLACRADDRRLVTNYRTRSGAGDIQSLTFDYGDGTAPVQVRPRDGLPSHTYQAAGRYVVTLTATAARDSSTATCTVTVR